MAKPIRPKRKLAFNPIHGTLDLVSDNNFAYESIPVNKKLKIRDNEQMVVHEGFVVDGELTLDGFLILKD